MSDRNIAMGERIRRARKSLNLTQQEFAERLQVTQPTVHRWEKGFYDPDESALQRLSAMTDLPPAFFRYGEQAVGQAPRAVTVVGHVGSDGQVSLDDNKAAGAPTIEVPASEALSAVAIVVRGDSLYPVYQDGDVIFYALEASNDEQAFLGRECVVKLARGPTLLKRVMRGSERGSYLLLSHNGSPVDNARLDWASPVRWIKRA
jgi:DNA-binding XRE family transcriptional regulator/phage repressor protein C with HTH and peptisase S24 domain